MRYNRRRPNFFYYDVTPYGENNEFNCVTRALTLVSHLPYYTVQRLLIENACTNNCDKLVMSCYDNLLEDYFGYERQDINYKYTVQEVADMYPNDTILIRINSHLTCAINGIVTDIFDCTNELVDVLWIKT